MPNPESGHDLRRLLSEYQFLVAKHQAWKSDKGASPTEAEYLRIVEIGNILKPYSDAGKAKKQQAFEKQIPPELRESLTAALAESKQFFASHKLANFEKALPAEMPPLSEAALARLREAREQGFDRMFIMPSARADIAKLLPLAKYKNEPYEGDSAAMHASTPRNRPEFGAYIVCYSSDSIPQETKGKTYPQLDEFFKEKKWDGLTYQEYLILQRLECEKRGEMSAKQHSFDGADNDAKKANWTWLLDSSAPAGRLDARWSPATARVYAYVYDSTRSNPDLGARPAVIVRF